MVDKKTWSEFRDSGLLWWINSLLHVFGWAIVIDINSNDEIFNAYQAKVKFRGFSDDINSEGYIKISEYLKEHIDELLKESKE